MNQSDFESQRSSKWYTKRKMQSSDFQTVVQQAAVHGPQLVHAPHSVTSLTSLVVGCEKFSGFQNV